MKIKICRTVSTEARQALRLATGIQFPGVGFQSVFDGNRIAPEQLISIMTKHGLAHEQERDCFKIFPVRCQTPWILRKQAV